MTIQIKMLFIIYCVLVGLCVYGKKNKVDKNE